MNILTSNAHFRQRVIKKSYKVGVFNCLLIKFPIVIDKNRNSL